ncbi:hypothetical protein ACTQ9L_02495 [Deinococcus wulumuqiensis]|uniref:Endonuclease/exonuclease/phosphatase domain-containing protein n=1 Tax=Deinococcus wulumuqiensis TaxID=980427 RepID=A0A345IHW5_9DEIO|nr:hypothetical protein [Deinococcus wulumuqiensis]AXG99287.1 hypothetical protein DVJ83_09170 [Deinococcus wulumuqiensis]
MLYNVARGGQGTAQTLLTTLRASEADLILLQETNVLDPAYEGTLLRGLPGYALIRIPIESGRFRFNPSGCE